jgi:uroporphyrinogen-III synthase
MLDLNGLHLLITRPEEQAITWANQLHSLGATTSLYPMLAIEAVTDTQATQAIVNKILRLDDYQKAIFVSQNAARYGAEWIDRYWPQLPQGLLLCAIGQTTANQLTHALCHLSVIVHSAQQAMNSETLLALPVFQNVRGEKILIFRGHGGRTHLAETLNARGASVDYCELYRRQMPSTVDHSPLQHYKQSTLLPVTVVHSGETLNNLCSAITNENLHWLQQQALLVPGQRVAEQARGLGFQHIISADNATHESMTEALHDWRKKR